MNKISYAGITAVPLLMITAACASDNTATPPANPQGGDSSRAATIPEDVNILYMMTDQQSYYMIGEITRRLASGDPYFGDLYVDTPNLDKLVRSGYTFTNAYAAHPVSGPSRFALLTGESPNSYAVWGNATPKQEPYASKGKQMVAERAMGNLFKNGGYNTYYGGKRHLAWSDGTNNINGEPSLYGFDHFITPDDRDELAQKAVEFFSEYNSPEPFLLFLSFMNPHDICSSPMLFSDNTPSLAYDNVYSEQYMSSLSDKNLLDWRDKLLMMGDGSSDSALEGFNDDTYAGLPANMAPTDIFTTDLYQTKPAKFASDNFQEWRAHRWLYYGLMQQVDALLGSVLNALEASPYADNTIVIFTSDHGELGGSHGVVGKNLPYQECQRVPFIFAGPGIIGNRIDNTTCVSNGMDLLPTMLDIAGLEIPEELHGVSLMKTITGGELPQRRYLYLETVNSYGVMEDGRYKYTRFTTNAGGGGFRPNSDNELLIDLKTDQGELTNLAYNHPEYSAILSRLKTALDEEMTLRGVSF